MASQDLALPSSITMRSREIAELTGKQHKHVLRDIDALLETLSPDLGRGFKTSTYRDASGKENRQFEMDRDSSYCVVAGYDANSRMRIIKRWQELEAEAAKPALNPANLSRLQLIEMAMQAEQERLALESKVAEIQPKAEAFDLIATGADGSMNITNTAKTLQIQPKVLFEWLPSHKWIYRRPGGRGWVAYQDKLQQGVLQHKITTIHKDDGTDQVTEQVLVTAKGLAKLAAIFRPLNGGEA